MNSAQKIIKYFGIGVAFLLIFSIFSLLIEIVFSVGNTFVPNIDSRNVSLDSNYLDVSLKVSRLEIKNGDSFNIYTDSKYISVKDDNSKITIKEKDHFNLNDSDVVVITIPSSYVFDDVAIDAGTGSINIEKLVTKNLSFDIGVGNVVIRDLVVYNNTLIDGGIGEFNIKNGIINNLDYDIGAGDANINAFINGTSDIDCGIGNFNLNLLNNISDVYIDLSLGVGSVNVNGTDVIKDSVFGIGRNVIEIDGGIGNINISTK